ncbi:MAG: hypothetical protein LWY06_07290 [Firmicutes bacterium]|nr:hypothetical protein [Bacillota bacterium]
MKKAVFTGALLFVMLLGAVLPVMAEDYNFTHIADIINIVEKSGRFEPHVTYFDKKLETEKYVNELGHPNPNHIVTIENGKKTIVDYKPSAEAAALYEKADGFSKSRKSKEAVALLKDGIKKGIKDFRLFLLLSCCSLESGSYKEACEYADEALKLNSGCWQAYTIKGVACFKLGDKVNSRASFVNALIYNHNDTEAWKGLIALGGADNFSVDMSPFVPLYSLDKVSSGKVRVYFDDNDKTRWLPYAFCKAVWKYEPGYFENRTGEKEYRLTPLEEMECLHGMIWAYGAFLKSGQFSKDPFMENLKKAERKMFLREYAYFNVLAPKNPEITWTLDDKYLDDMRDFIGEFIIKAGTSSADTTVKS